MFSQKCTVQSVTLSHQQKLTSPPKTSLNIRPMETKTHLTSTSKSGDLGPIPMQIRVHLSSQTDLGGQLFLVCSQRER